ncbi:DNA repair protein RadA [Stackebrandtia nassauensis]|uniref:DNA repair protein RadA n=1 Tax=Stackebrandtia nassauensis (strain DSM 44728 / CIP 108903 / NRRL B-16338 / NBRC 102104 / LLR-40K-21) TaxID=446470 RepID=D3Q1M2_STANL|nr:DNA repair protein RadA [Stackebrandtia nassauensis]ADD39870.1 DNA repair protein RadA [Stackebrandtia nassauensis DSM 44728]
MAKSPKTVYACSGCGHSVPKWVGKCPDCGEWGTMEAAVAMSGPAAAPRRAATARPAIPAQSIAQVSAKQAQAKSTGVDEFDRVLGGGLVPGGVVLIAGEPGVGKSTLLLDVAHRYAAAGHGRTLVATGEESAAQVRLRADRIGALHPDLMLAAETDLASVLGHIDDVKPGLLILDSVQTVTTSDVDGVPGGVTQVRAVAAGLISVAKERGITTILVGHVTKDGNIAGPRVLEHLVDTVVHFEGDRHSTLRLLRGVKNRFGPADEVGCFDMTEDGIVGLTDPAGLFLAESPDEPVPGTCVTVTMEGRRAMLVEVQALVGGSAKDGTIPRRTVSGLDYARLNMALAVLHQRGHVKCLDREVYAATVGGMKVMEPAADMAIILAVASSVSGAPVSADIVAIGEAGLTGAIRRVTGVPRRLAEAARLGFRHALVPPGCAEGAPKNMTVTEVSTIAEATRIAAQRWAARA